MAKGALDNNGALVRFRVDESALARKVRDLEGRFLQGNQAILRANERSVEWLGERAAKNLKKQRKRRPDPRHGRLAELVADPAASKVTVDGFNFFVYDQAAGINARVAAYWRAVEYGSNYWVDRTAARPLEMLFVGQPALPTRATTPVQAGYAGHLGPVDQAGRRSGALVRIINPIEAYGYLTAASNSFRRSNQYYKFAYAELAKVGLNRVVRAVKG